MTQPPSHPESHQRPSPRPVSVFAYPLGAIGALAGAALGLVVMRWGAHTGFYIEPVIGVFAGLAAGFLAPRGGWTVGAIAGLVTLALGVWGEWHFFPFIADGSLDYFLTHFTAIGPLKLCFHGLGIVAAVWLGARQ